jgi:putative oxidoreductase
MWNLVYALGRVAVVAVFVWSGVGKLMAPAGLTGMLSSKGFPMPMLLTYVAGLAEVVFGLLVAIGWQTRIASIALIAFTIVATLVAHDFWNMTGAARTGNQIQFFKNLAMVGGLMLLMSGGAGRYSVDRQ